MIETVISATMQSERFLIEFPETETKVTILTNLCFLWIINQWDSVLLYVSNITI